MPQKIRAINLAAVYCRILSQVIVSCCPSLVCEQILSIRDIRALRLGGKIAMQVSKDRMVNEINFLSVLKLPA